MPSYLFMFWTETGSHLSQADLKLCYVTMNDLEFLILLLPRGECWIAGVHPQARFL